MFQIFNLIDMFILIKFKLNSSKNVNLFLKITRNYARCIRGRAIIKYAWKVTKFIFLRLNFCDKTIGFQKCTKLSTILHCKFLPSF